MTSLSDTQRILLATAVQREGGSLLPQPPTLKPGGGTAKAIATLVTRGFAEERETGDPAATRRTEDDIAYGVFVTPAGLDAIGVEAESGGEPVAEPEQRAPDDRAGVVAPPPPPRATKSAAVLALLGRDEGATLPELTRRPAGCRTPPAPRSRACARRGMT